MTHGFRSGRSTLDLVLPLKMLLEKSWEWDNDKYAVFIDLEKALDRAPRQNLLTALQHLEYEVGPTLLMAIKGLTSSVKVR